MNEIRHPKAYTEESYPPVPTNATLYWRTNFLYQFFKFWKLNLKIMRIVVKGHS
jgi:hypothetical protein